MRGANGLWRVEDEGVLIARLRRRADASKTSCKSPVASRRIELSDADRARIAREEHEHVLLQNGDLNDVLETKHLDEGGLRSGADELRPAAFAAPSGRFVSPWVHAQVSLAEYRRKSAALRQPNEILTSGVVNILGDLSQHVRGPLAELLRELHRQLLQIVYALGSSTPHFVLEKQLEEEVKELRAQRTVLMEKQHKMKQEHERHKLLFDGTVQFWQQGLLRRTFSTWKRAVAMGKQHLSKMQTIFAKWYQGDDLLRIFFARWSAYRQAAVRKRLLDDLKKGSSDLAYHERIVSERERILRKKREQIATLEEEYSRELKACEALRKAAASEAENAADLAAAKAGLLKISQKLRRFADSLGGGLLRAVGTAVKQLAESPDASDLFVAAAPAANGDKAEDDEDAPNKLQRESSADSAAVVVTQSADASVDVVNNTDDDQILMRWLSYTLGILYESDPSKRTLLKSAESVADLAHLGLCLDLERCIPQRLRAQAEEKVSSDIVTEFMDLESYNSDHVEIVKSLMQVQYMCQNDIRNSSNVRGGARLSLSRGSTIFDTDLLEIQTAHRTTSGPHHDGNDREAGPTTLSRTTLLSRQMSSRRSLFERQSSKLLHSGLLEGDAQSQAGKSIASQTAVKQDDPANFVDESLPVVAMTEILEALEPDGADSSSFLVVFLSQFMLASPLLPPLLASEDKMLEDLAQLRSDFQRVSDLFLGDTGRRSSDQTAQRQLRSSHHQLTRGVSMSNSLLLELADPDADEEADLAAPQSTQDEIEMLLQNPDAHIGAVIEIKCKWQEVMHEYFQRTSLARSDSSWENATRLAENAVWHRLTTEVSHRLADAAAKTKTQRRKSSTSSTKRRRGSQSSTRVSHGSFVRKHGVILVMPSDLSAVVERAMEAHQISLSGLPDLFLEHSKVLSILLDRYESPIDMIKEARLVDPGTLAEKKHKTALAAVCVTENKSPLEIVVFALFFVADVQFDAAIEKDASASYEGVMRMNVFERLSRCAELTSGDLAIFTAEHNSTVRQLFHRLRTKNAPIDQLSLANWKHLPDGNRWLMDKNGVTKQFITDVFHACNSAGEDCDKAAQGLTLTEFKHALVMLARAHFPGFFSSDKEKLSDFLSQLKK